MFFNPIILRPTARLSTALSRSLILSLILAFSSAVFANEEPAKPKPEAASGPGGDKAWVTLQNQVLVLSTRRKQLQQNMEALKDQTRHHNGKGKEDPRHIKAEVDQLVKLYKEYKEVTEEYNKLIVVLKYRFPERLAKDEAREYKPVEVESLEEMEAKMDIEGRLNRAYKKAQSQYSPVKERAPSSEKPNLPPSKDASPREKTIREQDPLLLSQ